MTITFPTGVPTDTPDNTDQVLFSDTSDADNLKKNTPGAVVAAGLPSNDTDSLPQGATNLYMTSGEKVKLAGIQTGAQTNAVDSVNGQVAAVSLDQDDIPDGATFVRTNNNFTNTAVSELNAATNHLTDFNNPHNTTPANIGIGNVVDELQLSTTPGNFSAKLVEKSDIQQHLEDKFVIEDSADSDQIKYITNQTDLIWKASLCQVWGPSINYYRFDFVSNTSYDIRSIVVFGGNLYLCTVNHQSSGSFAADLANGFWTLIGTGGVPGGVSVTTGAGAPVTPGTSAGDLYIDNVNNQLYIWDGATWNLYTSPFGTTTGVPVTPGTVVGDAKVDLANGNIYIWDGATWVLNEGAGGAGGVTYVTAPTTGDRLVFSSGIGADKIDESVIIYTSLPTPTINMNNITTTGIQNFDSNYVSNYNGSTQNYTQITQNFTDTPVQISCEGAPLFATPFTAPVGTQWVEIKVEYDNGVDPVVAQTIVSLFDGNTQDIVFSTPTDSGTIQVSWAAGDVTATITAGTPGFFSFGTPDSWCYYNGVSVNNYQNKIHIHEGDITQNTNTYTTNNSTTEVYDSNSTTIHNGNVSISNLNVTNVTVNGQTGSIPLKKTASWNTGGGATSVTFADTDSVANSVIAGWTVTSGTQVGFWEFDLSTPGSITINSTATETGTIDFTYVIHP